MAHPPRTLALAEACRFTLRAIYSIRPELADEIKSAAWFIWPTTKSQDEIQAATAARKLFEDLVADERIRLRGALASLPRQDINPADCRIGKLDVFDGQLIVSGYGIGVIRRYRYVTCYETDLYREVNHRGAKSNGITNRKPMSIAPTATNNRAASTNEISKFVSDYIKNNPTTASQDGIREQWKTLHGAHRRADLDAEWRNQAESLGLLRKRGQKGEIAKS